MLFLPVAELYAACLVARTRAADGGRVNHEYLARTRAADGGRVNHEYRCAGVHQYTTPAANLSAAI